MDTKKLYIKSQKTVLNWGLGLATAFFIITLCNLIINRYSVNRLSLMIQTAIYTCMFAFSLINRIKINKNAALVAFSAYALFSIYLIVDMIVKAKQTYTSICLAFPNSPLTLTLISYTVGLTVIFGVNFLYYKVYKSTLRIQTLESKSH